MGEHIKNGNAHAPSNFKVWRESMGFSVDDACALLEISKAQVADWESESAPVPRHILLACAALALGIKV